MHDEIAKTHELFYANLFSRNQIDLNIQSSLLENISACLSETDHLTCEGDISLLEATTAFKVIPQYCIAHPVLRRILHMISARNKMAAFSIEIDL